MRWILLLFVFVAGSGGCRQFSSESQNNEQLLNRLEKIFKDSLLLSKWSDPCNQTIDFENFVRFVKEENRYYWDTISKPDYWTDSEYCDDVFWQSHMQLKNPDYIEFNEVLPKPCLNWALKEQKLESIEDLKKYTFFSELIKRTDFKYYPSIQEVDLDLLKELRAKYSQSPNKAIGFSKKKNGIKYTAVCYYFMNGFFVDEMSRKLNDPRFIFFCNTEIPLSAEPFELFIEYEFIKTEGIFQVRRRILNPYVLNEYIVY